MSDYRLIQDGQPVAWANFEREIAHYALVYGEDGPVKVQRKINSRWNNVLTSKGTGDE